MDNNCASSIFTDVICANKIAAFSSHSPNEVAVLLGPDDKTVYGMNFTDTHLIYSYILSQKYKSKKRCQICAEKNKKYYKRCSQCCNEYCDTCFNKINAKSLCCPFCRYTFKNHINNKIDEFKMEKDKTFTHIFEGWGEQDD